MQNILPRNTFCGVWQILVLCFIEILQNCELWKMHRTFIICFYFVFGSKGALSLALELGLVISKGFEFLWKAK